MDGRGGIPRNLPRCFESAEVVDANPVHGGKQRVEARDPPGVSGPLEHVPLVVWVPPELSRRAEVVGRHARHDAGTAVSVELKQFTSRPDIGAVVRDEDGQIAHDDDPSRPARLAQALPLLEKEELRQLVQPDVTGAACRPPRERVGIALCDVGLPLGPGRVAVRGLDGHVEGEILQPRRVRATESIELVVQRERRGRIESIEHAGPQRSSVCDHCGEIDVAGRKGGPGCVRRVRRIIRVRSFCRREEALVDETVEADEQGIASERGQA